MSIKHNKAGGNAEMKKEIQEVKKETQEVKMDGKNAAMLLTVSFKALILLDRAMGTDIISDDMILASTEVIEYPEYEDSRRYDVIGEIIRYKGRYYEIIAPHISSESSSNPETTFAYYRLVKGTETDNTYSGEG